MGQAVLSHLKAPNAGRWGEWGRRVEPELTAEKVGEPGLQGSVQPERLVLQDWLALESAQILKLLHMNIVFKYLITFLNLSEVFRYLEI